jgi:hypothetical protein
MGNFGFYLGLISMIVIEWGLLWSAAAVFSGSFANAIPITGIT